VKHPEVSCIDGNTFMVSDLTGDVEQDHDRVLGLFYRDVRHLSTWQLSFDGRTLDALSNDAGGYRAATFFLTAPGANVYDNPTVSVFRTRSLGEDGGQDLREDLRISNSGPDELVVEVSVNFDADFADIFEVKDKTIAKKGTVSRKVHSDRVELVYTRGEFVRRTVIHADAAVFSQGSAGFLIKLAPGRLGQPRCGSPSAPTPQSRSYPPMCPPRRRRIPTATAGKSCRNGWRPRPRCEPAGTTCTTPTSAA
jgi:glycogen debranching enzyme